MNDETPLSEPSLEGVEIESPMEEPPSDPRDEEIIVLKEESATLKDRLLRMAAGLNAGVDPAGKELGGATAFVLATGAEPGAHDYERELRRLEDKKAAGAELIMTQPVYDPRTLDRFLDDVAPLGLPVMVGLLPLASHRNAEFLHNEVPGITIPEDVRRRLHEAGDGALRVGIEMAQELVRAVRTRYAGAYLMPSFGRFEVVAEILDAIR